MTIRLVADETSVRGGVALADFLANLPRSVLRDGQRAIQTAVLRGFARNFHAQAAGSGAPWRPLALVTQQERQRRGYPPQRPILVQSGKYRSSLVNASDPQHISFAALDGGKAIFEEGSASPLLEKHEAGEGRIPARPATELSAASRDALAQTLDLIVRAAERRAVR